MSESSKYERCLVLGGAGFLGSHLVERLVEHHCEVTAFDLPRRDRANLRKVLSQIRVLEGDFGNSDDLRRAIQDQEIVFHLVGTTLPAGSNENPAYDVSTNVLSSIQLFEICAEQRVRKVIFVSSGGTVYGVARQLPIPEDHPTEPLSAYGISKLTIEKFLQLFHHLHQLDYTVLRLANPYGGRQGIGRPQGAVTVFLRRLVRDEPIEIWGDGSVVRDYVYVEDAVEALWRAKDRESESKIFNIGTGRGTSLRELLELMARISGKTPRVIYRPARKADVPSNILDPSRAEQQLGWHAKMPLEEGLRLVWEELLASAKEMSA